MPTDMLQDCARLQELLASIRPSIPSQYDDDNQDGTPDANDTGTHEVPDTGTDPAPTIQTPTSRDPSHPRQTPPQAPPPISVVPTQPDWNPVPEFTPHPEDQYPPLDELPDFDPIPEGVDLPPLDPLFDPTPEAITEVNMADILPFSPGDRIPTPKQFSHDQTVWNESIDRNPGDDTQKLIYADWLEENGQERQAHRMRAAVEASVEARTQSAWSMDWIPGNRIGHAIRKMNEVPEWAQMLYGVELARATMDTVNIAPNSPQVQEGIGQALEIAFRYACGVATADEVWNARTWIDRNRGMWFPDGQETSYTDQYFLEGLASILEPTRNGVIRNLPAAVVSSFLAATNNAFHASQHESRDEQENQLRAEITRLTDVYQRLAQTDEAEPEGYSRYSHGGTSLSRMAETLQEIRYDLDYADSVPDEDTYDISDSGVDDPEPRSSPSAPETPSQPQKSPQKAPGGQTSAPPRGVVPTVHPQTMPDWKPLPPEFTPHPEEQYPQQEWEDEDIYGEETFPVKPEEDMGVIPGILAAGGTPPQSFPAEQQRWHQAIDESPYDDTPKLVYADYLDETGHEDEAFRLRWAANTSRAAAASQAPEWVAPERIYEAGRIMNDAPQWVQTLYGVDLAKQTLPLIQQSLESSLFPIPRQNVLRYVLQAMGVAQRFAVGLATPQEAEVARTAIRGMIPSGSLSQPAQAFLNALAIILIPNPQGPYQSVPVAATPLFQEAIRSSFRSRDMPVTHEAENSLRHMVVGTADVYQQAMQQGSQEWEARQRKYARYDDEETPTEPVTEPSPEPHEPRDVPKTSPVQKSGSDKSVRSVTGPARPPQQGVMPRHTAPGESTPEEIHAAWEADQYPPPNHDWRPDPQPEWTPSSPRVPEDLLGVEPEVDWRSQTDLSADTDPSPWDSAPEVKLRTYVPLGDPDDHPHLADLWDHDTGTYQIPEGMSVPSTLMEVTDDVPDTTPPNSEEQAFRQKWNTSPNDSTNKLVYADYLEETGQPEKAYDIRWVVYAQQAGNQMSWGWFDTRNWFAEHSASPMELLMRNTTPEVQWLYGIDLTRRAFQEFLKPSTTGTLPGGFFNALGVLERHALRLASAEEVAEVQDYIIRAYRNASANHQRLAQMERPVLSGTPESQNEFWSYQRGLHYTNAVRRAAQVLAGLMAAPRGFDDERHTLWGLADEVDTFARAAGTYEDARGGYRRKSDPSARSGAESLAAIYWQFSQDAPADERDQRGYARYAESVPEEETFSIADEGIDTPEPPPRETPQDRPGSTNTPKASNPAPSGTNPSPHSVKPVSRPSFSPQVAATAPADYPTPDWSSPPEPGESQWEQEPTEVPQDATEQPRVPTSEQENWNFVFDTSGDDNTPKLVYADYLDENGQEEAAFRLRSMVSAGDQIRRVVNSGELYNGRQIGDVLGAFTQMQEQPEWKRVLYLADLAEWSVSQVLPKVFRDQAAPVISVARRVALGLATSEDQRWAAERIQEMEDDNEAVRQEHANRGDPDAYRGYDYSGVLRALTTLFDFHGDGSNFRHGVWAFCNAPYRHQQGENQMFTPSRSLVTGIGNTAAVMARIYADQPSQPPTNASRYSRRSFTVNETDQEEACAYVAMKLAQLLPTLYQASGEPSTPTAGGNSEYTPSPGGTPDRDYYRQKTPYYTPPRPIQGQNPPIPYGGDAKCGQCGLKFFVAKNSVNSNCPRCGASSLQYVRYADDTRDRGPANPKPEATKKDNDEPRPKAPLGTGLLEMLVGPIESPEFLVPEESDYAAVERPPVSYDTMMYNCYQMMDKLAGCR